MELKDYTTDELRAEIKRRAEMKRKEKAEEMKKAARCRNCKHCVRDDKYGFFYNCAARTWGKTITRHYRVTPSMKACELFEMETE